MNKTLKGLASVLAFASLTGCNGLSDLENRVNVLESKVEAFETVLDVLNGNVSTMQALIDTSIPVTSVSEAGGVYTLVFADGTSATLAQGSEGVGVTPVVSIDEAGYWTVNYGNGPEYIYKDQAKTQKVKAEGENASVPVFGVDASGDYWTVSTDGGKTFTPVKDGEGNPVPVQISGSGQASFFEEVSYENDVFTVKLKDLGKVLEIPVISSFYFRIEGSDVAQEFAYGQTRTFRIEQKGVASTLLTVPDGWSGSLSGETLTLTAPLMTRSLTVDSSSEVSVLATSAKGYAVVAKMKVEMLSNDLWERYNEGKDIVVGGLVVNRTTYPGAELISESRSGVMKGVYFLEPGVEAKISGGNPSQLIVIGRYADRRSTLKRERYLNYSATSGEDYLVFANVELDFTLTTDDKNKAYMFTLIGNDNFETIIFENMKIEMPDSKAHLLYMRYTDSSPDRSMNANIVVKDCDINVAKSSGVSVICSDFTGEKGKIASVEFTGNTVSSGSGSSDFRVIQTSEQPLSLKMESNTLVNVTVAEGSEVNIEN